MTQDLTLEIDNIRQLNTFTRAYVECAMWLGMDGQTDADESDPSLDMRDEYDWSDLTRETRERILEDCTAFQEAHENMIARDLVRAGHDFYLTRNGHGAGFWDGDWPAQDGRTLTDASKPYGEFQLVLQDDGQIGHWG